MKMKPKAARCCLQRAGPASRPLRFGQVGSQSGTLAWAAKAFVAVPLHEQKNWIWGGPCAARSEEVLHQEGASIFFSAATA